MDTPLAHLIEQERAISAKRRRIHRELEFLQGTGAHQPGTAEKVAALQVEEREISAKRRELHVIIDRLRAAMPEEAAG